MVRKGLNALFGLLISVFFLPRCATDPGTGTSTTGGAICKYADCDARIAVNFYRNDRLGANIVVGFIAFAPLETTNEIAAAYTIENGTSITFPNGVTLTISGCPQSASLSSTTAAPTFQLYNYTLAGCMPTGVEASGSLTITNGLSTRNIGATATGTGSSGGSPLTQHTTFLTSTAYAANFGGLAAADTLCQTHAASGSATASLGGTWKFLGSDQVTSAASRITILHAIYNTFGQVIATSSSDLWDGTITNPILYDENGTVLGGGTRVWTGTQFNGVKNSGTICSSWTVTGAGLAYRGMAADTSMWMEEDLTTNCNASNRLYCINQ